MLSKLLKQELKATARLLVPIYLILVLLTVMDRIVLSLNIFEGYLAVIPGFITFAYVVAIIAVIMVSSIFMIVRFYKNLLTDEGYLMFTLPVKSYQLINAKLLIAIFWTVASVLAVIASIVAVAATPNGISEFIDAFKTVWNEIKAEFGGITALLIIEFIVMIILSIINNILMIYVSIALGQLFNGHKVIGAFAAYMGISTVLQFVVTALVFLAGFIFRQDLNDISTIPNLVFPCTIFFLAVLSAVYYFVTDYIFRKKLNLE